MNLSHFDFYNRELKEKFLEQYNEETARTYAYSLARSRFEEELFGKDLYNFNLEQISKILPKFKACNLNGVKKHALIIDLYMTWAAENGYRNSNISVLKGMDNEFYERFVMNKKMFINEDELKEYEDTLVNYQDKLTLRLPYEGLTGYKMSLMRNLNIKCFTDKPNVIRSKDDRKGEREIEVSDRCIEFIKKGIAEDIYFAKNGESEGYIKELPLTRNDYVIRINAKKNKENSEIDTHNLHRRLKAIKEGIDLPAITFKSLERSGMIAFAKDLFVERGKLGKEEFNIIGDRYNLSKLHAGGKEYHNTTMMKTYINRENILELYGIDIGEDN